MIRTDYAPLEGLQNTDLNDAFKSLKCNVPGDALHQYNEVPAYVGPPTGKFQTAFPFKAGTLQVYVGQGADVDGMSRQILGVNYTESGTTFTFIAGPGVALTDAETAGSRVRVDYVRSDL